MARTIRKKNSDEPNPVGRPSAYKPEYCQLLIEHMKVGFSFESFGGIVGHGTTSLYRWLEAHEEFRDAKKIAEAYSRLHWEKMGMDGLWNHTENGSNLNTTNWIFQMKNRFGWRDKKDVEVSGPDGGAIKTQELSREKKLTELQRLTKLLKIDDSIGKEESDE